MTETTAISTQPDTETEKGASESAHLVQLTTSSQNEVNPDWSPDGSEIIYCRHESKVSGKSYPHNIWVINVDGSNEHPLTHSKGWDCNRQPKWSPDGSKIAFWAYRPWGQGGSIWLMNADGTGEKKIYRRGGYDCYKPVFSPDGSKIAYDSKKRYHGSPFELYVMNSDGTHASKILDAFSTKNDGFRKAGGSISYSPDGRWLAFESERSGNWDIWVIRTDGTDLAQLTTEPSSDYYPAWSPDGRQIAFVSDRAGNADIWVLANVQEVTDGKKPRYIQLTTDPRDDRSPAWSPDETKIAFSSNRNGNYDIWLVSTDGEGLSPKFEEMIYLNCI